MRLTEDSRLAQQMLEDLGREIHIDKPLPHVTEVIYCLTHSYMDRFHPLPPTPGETLLFVCGVGLEKVLLQLHRQHLAGEKDGIHFDTDFLNYLDLPGELKTTRISEKTSAQWASVTGIPVKDKKGQVIDMPETWIRQVLAYFTCNDATEGTLAILHLMGNYAPPFPSLRTWLVKATEEELHTNWEWMLRRKSVYMGFVDSRVLPEPHRWCLPWECTWGQGCRYKIFCDAKLAGGS